MPMTDIAQITSTLRAVNVAPGQDLLVQGSTGEHLYILETGQVEVLKDGVKITDVAEPGAVFGEMAILLNCAHTATVRAVTPSVFRVAEFSKAYLLQHPALSLHVAEILARRLDSLNRYLIDVKSQFKEFDDHVGMVDEVLEVLMTKHPRRIDRRDFDDPNEPLP